MLVKTTHNEALGLPMSSDPNKGDEDRGQVLQFRARKPQQPVQAFGNLAADDSPVPDVSRYAHDSQDTDDYAHRMKMNALAVVALVVLIGGGIWIVDTMTQMRKNQDCALMGRRNCAGVTTPPSDRVSSPLTVPASNR
jgi:hypothetical protein